MGEGLQMLDMLVLLALAIFFISRLRNVLGKHIDGKDAENRPKPGRKSGAQKSAAQERVIHLRSAKEAAVNAQAVQPEEDDAPLLADIGDPDVSKGLMSIKSAEPGFSVREFVMGAKMAFEMIVDAYAKGDKAQLRSLLSKEIYADFEEALEESRKADVREETTLVSIQSADVTRAVLKGKTAEITVQFVSEQITVERDRNNAIVSGDPSQTHLVTDEWTFAREVRSSNPNWMLVGT